MVNKITLQEYETFRCFLEEMCGIVLGDSKQYLVYSRLRRLMDEYEVNSLGELVVRARGENESTLRGCIINAMTTNETSWFRDSYPYDILKDLIYPDLSSKGKKEIRIWSAASSTGQEAYSISITTNEYNSNIMVNLPDVKIVATDISQDVLQRAKQGVYDNISIARGLTEERIKRYFESTEGSWKIKDVIKERVVFQELNLMKSFAKLGKFDVIYCRNVLIYFSTFVKKDIITRLLESLNPGGYLILGGSESMPLNSENLETIRYKNGMVYKRKTLK